MKLTGEFGGTTEGNAFTVTAQGADVDKGKAFDL